MLFRGSTCCFVLQLVLSLIWLTEGQANNSNNGKQKIDSEMEKGVG